MAKRPNKQTPAPAPASAPAPAGHNVGGGLTEEQEEALQTYYELNIRKGVAAVEAAMAVVKEKRNAVNGEFKRMTADLGDTRAEFEIYLKDIDMNPVEFMAREARRARRHRLGGLVKGAQQDLALGDTVDDQVAAEAAGRRAYRAFKDPTPPAEISPILHQDWMRGWQDEQSKVGMQMGMAQEIIDARANAGKLTSEEPEEDAEVDEDPADPEVIKAQARKLKDSGWTEPTKEEGVFA